MPDPIPFRPTRRALRLLSFRSAATPPAAPQTPAQGSPQPEPASVPSCEVVRLADRRPAPVLGPIVYLWPWWF